MLYCWDSSNLLNSSMQNKFLTYVHILSFDTCLCLFLYHLFASSFLMWKALEAGSWWELVVWPRELSLMVCDGPRWWNGEWEGCPRGRGQMRPYSGNPSTVRQKLTQQCDVGFCPTWDSDFYKSRSLLSVCILPP